MLRLKPAKRSAATAMLLLHLLVLAVVPLAHAAPEAAPAQQAVHITAPQDVCCAPVHNDLTCDICRTLRASSHTPTVTVAFTLHPTAQPAAPRTAVLPLQSSHPPSLHSRAPPLLHV